MTTTPHLFADLGAPYYVYAPPFRENSGGVRAMHYVCHALNLIGQEAYITTDVLSDDLRTPVLTDAIRQRHAAQGREPVVIYPEVIGDNPLRARHVVRYLLNVPSLLTGQKTWWGEDDMIYTHGVDVVPQGMQAKLLQTPLINTRIFNKTGVDDSQRSGGLLWIHRFLDRGGQLTAETDGFTEISYRVGHRTPQELAQLYRSARFLYTHEPSTACYEALMCGCPVVYLPNDIMLAKPMLNYLTSAGSAWGSSAEQIDYALRTVHDIPAVYDGLEKLFWQELDEFVAHTQSRVRASSRPKAQSALPTPPTPAPAARRRLVLLSAEPSVSPCPYLRFTRPFSLLEDQWDLQWGIQGANISLDLLKSADLIVFQRYTPGVIPIPVLEQIFALGKKVVYETDDLLHDVPDYHPQVASARQWREGVEYVARRAHAVVVSTPFLADKLRQLNANVHVLPNYIDYQLHYRQPSDDSGRKIHIGLVGTSLQGPNFALVDQALRALLAKYPGRIKLFFVGWAAPAGWENHPDAEFHPVLASYLDYAALLRRMALDIALTPLADDEFNHSKTAIKWLEYSSAGIAGIFSDVAIYRNAVTDGQTGLLAANDPSAWLDALCALVDDPQRRVALAEAAQAQVHQQYDVAKGAAEYGQVYGALLAPAAVHATAPAAPAAAPAVTRAPLPASTPAAAGLRKPALRPLAPARADNAAAPSRAPVRPPLPGRIAPVLKAAAPATAAVVAATPAPAPAPAKIAVAAAVPRAPERALRVAVVSVESTWSPCPQIRLILPFAFMGREWELEWAIKEGRFDQAVMDRADIVVMHRFTPGLLPQGDLETLMGGGKIIVYETDDLLNDIPDYHPQAADSRKWKAGIEYTVRHAHAVTVSTPFLAEKYRALNANIHVLPNYLDFDRFYRAVPQAEPAQITIGLLGTSIGGPNFALVSNALRVLCHRYPDKLKLHLVGWECPEEWKDHPAVRYEPFIHAYQDYAAKLLEWNWDIALVPLVDDDFNHSKSAIKFLEYAAAGIATAFSDVVVYNKIVEDGRTGLLVEQSQGAWLGAIEKLVTQPALRRQLARTAQAEVRKQHSLHENAWRYQLAYRSIAGLALPQHVPHERNLAILLLDRAGDPQRRQAALDQLNEGKQSWLPKVILTTQQGELPATGDQLRYVQFAVEEFDAALALLAAHEDFDWYSIIEVE